MDQTLPIFRPNFIRHFVNILSCIVVVTSSVCWLFWGTFVPCSPLPTFNLTSISLSNFSNNATHLTDTWQLTFHCQSHSAVASFDDVHLGLFFRSVFIADSAIPQEEDVKKRQPRHHLRNLVTIKRFGSGYRTWARQSSFGSFSEKNIALSISS